ncbi:MAG: pilus assembly protein TadG-related protein [Paracoccaceae bacterium]
MLKKTIRCAFPKARTFRSDESGAMVVFGVFLLVLLIAMGGFALDLMRYEERRTQLQNSLDRCTLMAASLTNDLDPESVVNDCMTRSGLGDELEDVQVLTGLNFKDVQAKGRVDTKPIFMHMIGIDEFDALGASGALQRASNIEIVLVLDVSGSMSGTKLANLKTAASEFVDTVLSTDTEDRISVSIVPYNAQVNLGQTLRAKYNATHLHGVANVNCLEIPAAAYASATMSRTDPMPMAAFADVSSGTYGGTAYTDHNDTSAATMNPNAPFCRNTEANIVRLPSNDIGNLQGQINALVAGGNTSITLGMKWGLTLIDPAARPMFNEFRAEGAVPSEFVGRPFDWTDTEAMKVIVLMTDGEHVAHPKTNNAVKTGPSPIWRSTGDGAYSILHASQAAPNQYWVPHLGTWQATPWDSGAGATQMSWNDMWARQRQSWIGWQLYARALGTDDATRSAAYSNAMNMFRSQYASVGAMNAQLQQSCTLAKNNDVIVYGIAFEAPANGQTQISQCSSSASHYFDAADGDEIRTAFRTIASNITQLKLTQ